MGRASQGYGSNRLNGYRDAEGQKVAPQGSPAPGGARRVRDEPSGSLAAGPQKRCVQCGLQQGGGDAAGLRVRGLPDNAAAGRNGRAGFCADGSSPHNTTHPQTSRVSNTEHRRAGNDRLCCPCDAWL